MRQPVKAALLSGLVYPGLGQANNGQRVKGLIIALLITVLLLVLMYSIMAIIIKATGWPWHFRLDAEILADIHRRAYSSNVWSVTAVVVLWLFSIIDAYRAGRQVEKRQEQAAAFYRGASPGGRSDPLS